MLVETSIYVCSACKANNRINAKFCKGCGSELLEEDLKIFISCPKCKELTKKASKFCSKCGFSIKRLMDSKTFPSAPVTTKVTKLKDLNLNAQAVQDILIFFATLKEAFQMDLEEISGIINYQKHLFESSDKGLVLLREDTGHVVLVNNKFEEFMEITKKEILEKNFFDVLLGINTYNKNITGDNILSESEFFIFNRDYEKFSVKFERNSALFDNNIIFAVIDNSDVVKHKWLKKDRGTTTKKLFLVAKIVEEINSSLELEVILSNTLERLMDATRSDSGLIMFIDENSLIPISYKGISDFLIKDLIENPVNADKGSRGKSSSPWKKC